jgi:hypothetical protein
MAKTKTKYGAPQRYADITKAFVIAYIRDNGSDEDKAWYIELISKPENQMPRATKNGTKQDLKMKNIRRAFCEKFAEFSHLLPDRKVEEDLIEKQKREIGL